ncbi:hypothetical protein Bca4012_100631 [Brassica carinata]
MGDQDKEKNVENPEVVQKVCDGPLLHQTEQTVHAIAQRLCRFLSPIRLPLLVFYPISFCSVWYTLKVVLVQSKGHVPRLGRSKLNH